MRKIVSLFLILCFIQTATIAVDFDDSIDANIRKEYNLDDNNLPKLPSSVPTATVDIPKVPTYNPTGKTYKLISGTKVNVVSNSSISDKFAEGIKISFSAQEGFVTQDGTIIPAGTIFKGTITDAHQPQITGNGGLIELSNVDFDMNTTYYRQANIQLDVANQMIKSYKELLQSAIDLMSS